MVLSNIYEALVEEFNLKPVGTFKTISRSADPESKITVTYAPIESPGDRGRVSLSHDDYEILTIVDNGQGGQDYGLFAYVYAQEAFTSDLKFKLRDADIRAHGLLSGAIMRACEYHRLKLNTDGYDKKDIVESRSLAILMMNQRAA